MSPRRPLSPIGGMVFMTVVLGVVFVGVVHNRAGESPTYRNGTAPALHGIVVSGPQHRDMRCGRGNHNGYQVAVRFSRAGATRTEALPVCRPSSYPPSTAVTVWQERPGVLTLSSPGHSGRLAHVVLIGLVVLWVGLMGLFSVLLRRRAVQG